jgi:hypothetical protein
MAFGDKGGGCGSEWAQEEINTAIAAMVRLNKVFEKMAFMI